jgi:hypothetical protein
VLFGDQNDEVPQLIPIHPEPAKEVINIDNGQDDNF